MLFLAAELVLAQAPGTAPRVSAELVAESTVHIELNHRPSRLQKRARFQLQRASIDSEFVTVAEVPHRRGGAVVFDYTSESGELFYRARAIAGRSRSRWSKIALVTVEVPEPTTTITPTPLPTPLPPPPDIPQGFAVCGRSIADRQLQAVNLQRTAAGVAALEYNEQLENAALAHSVAMALAEELTHEGWYERIAQYGFHGTHYGQNVAAFIEEPEDVVTAMLDSPGHAANMLNPRALFAGIGCIEDREGVRYWTQNFGG